ncbi:unnamed protein product [Symbiodinium natans]|uniref:Uncharacterized protein n=1 Tax=Symbiodinium natans TaxID=878477 RepID=A0A812Q579_9DINO|nr:unnamed protein product [Symbiodinium natans]
MHMAANLEKPAFQAYCTWRAYGEALRELETTRSTKFRRVCGAEYALKTFPPKPAIKASPEQAALDPNELGPSASLIVQTFNLSSSKVPTDTVGPRDSLRVLEAALRALTEAGLCSKAVLQLDEVLVEVWGEGGSEDLVLPILIEGDPLVDAQLILSEELAPPVLPDPILAVLVAWLEEASGPGYASLQNYYVNSRWRGRTEYSNMVYVPKQRLFQLTLHRHLHPAPDF